MKGILTLGRFLLWLLVFLFFYSSIMILMQYGTSGYASKMLSSWGSVGQEFQKSYETLRTGAPAPGEAAQPGETGQPAAMPSFVPLLIWGSIVLFLLGFFWLVAVGFQESLLWGLAVLFTGIGALLFWVSHFRESTPPFLLVIISSVVFTFTVANYNIDPYEYFLGPPPKPAEKQPGPLDDIVPPAPPGKAPAPAPAPAPAAPKSMLPVPLG